MTLLKHLSITLAFLKFREKNTKKKLGLFISLSFICLVKACSSEGVYEILKLFS